MKKAFWIWIFWFTFLFLLDFSVPFYVFEELPMLTGSFLFWIVWIVVAMISMFAIFLKWRENDTSD